MRYAPNLVRRNNIPHANYHLLYKNYIAVYKTLQSSGNHLLLPPITSSSLMANYSVAILSSNSRKKSTSGFHILGNAIYIPK